MLKIKPRTLILHWHRWFGLLASLWLILLSITGAILVFYQELDEALNPELFAVSATHKPMDSAAWIDVASSTFPHHHISMVNLPRQPDAPVVITLLASENTTGLEPRFNAYIDPYSAALLGTRANKIALNKRHIMQVVYALHIDLLLGETMVWILGLVAFLWVLDHFASLYLSFPSRKQWKKSFSFRFNANAYKLLFDLHRSGGVWLAPFTLVLAFTGLYFNWYEPVTHTIDKFAPIKPRYIFTLPKKDTSEQHALVSLGDALAIGQTYDPDADIDMIRHMPHLGVYDVRVHDERDIDPYGRRYVVISDQNGDVLDDSHALTGSVGNAIVAWQYPLHSGKAFGWTGRLIVFFVGLAVLVFCVTGLRIFIRKRFKR